MPLYEFRCESCGERFEKLVRWSDAEQKPHCPHCGGEETRKLISTVSSFGSGESSSGLSSGGSCGSSGGFS
jgi:putative FmdB family regulatory protein